MIRILMTGGSGFVGRNLLEYTKKYCDGLFFIDAPSSKELDVVSPGSVDSWFSTHERYDAVLHFAVYTNAANSERDAGKMLEYNLLSFMNFERHRKDYGEMYYSGSGAEYDKGSDIVSVTEEEIDKRSVPSDQYGLMKRTIGRLIEESDNLYNVRIFGLFGKYEYSFRFITEMIRNSIEGKSFTVNKNVVFDYLYIDQFCAMLTELILKRDKHFKTYNMVSGNKVSLLEICDIINETAVSFGKKMQEIIVRQEGLNKEYTASAGRIRKECPAYREISMKEAIRDYYGYFLKEDSLYYL